MAIKQGVNDMLNEFQDDQSKHGQQPPVEEEPKQLTLMSGVAKGNDRNVFDAALDVDETAPKSVISQNMLLLLVVGLIAAGTIYAMGLTQGDLTGNTVQSDAEARIEQAITQLAQKESVTGPLQESKLRQLFDETDDIVKMFTSDRSERQVPLEYVKKNPFEMVLPRTEEPQAVAPVDHGREAREREQLLQRLNNEAQRLRVEMISSGSRGWVAMVNGDFVQVGSKVGSFEVVKIEQFKVTLEAHDQSFELSLSR